MYIFYLAHTLILSVLLGYFIVAYRKLKNKQRARSLVDLEWATSEQLLTELRNRPKANLVIIRPTTTQDSMNITVELTGLTPDMGFWTILMSIKAFISGYRQNGRNSDHINGLDEKITEYIEANFPRKL